MNEVKSNAECPICLDDVKEDARLVSVNCPLKHQFHKKCITTALHIKWNAQRNFEIRLPGQRQVVQAFPFGGLLNLLLRFEVKEPAAYSCCQCTSPITQIDGEPIPEPEVFSEETFIRDVARGNLEGIQKAIASGNLDVRMVSAAIQFAKTPEIVKVLLETRKVLGTVRGWAIARAENKEIFDVLMHTLPLDNAARSAATLVCAEHGNLEKIRQMGEIPDVTRSRALCIAIYHRQNECASYFFNMGPLSDFWRQNALIAAANNPSEEIWNLVESDNIPTDLRGSLYVLAYKNRNYKIAERIKENGPIPCSDRMGALGYSMFHAVSDRKAELFGAAFTALLFWWNEYMYRSLQSISKNGHLK